MKIFALGGYGKTALPAIKLLAQSNLVTEIAVAGRNLERAENAAAEIGEKAIPVHADGTDEIKLTPLLAGYDILMNAAYNDTVISAIRAATRAGIDYCDVAWGDVLEQAVSLDSNAKTAGITAIVATGISPCISNLMCVHVASQLDEVEQLQFGRADIMSFENGRESTPEQWLKNPKESLAALPEFKPYLTMTMQRLENNGNRTIRCYQKGQWMDMDPIRDGMEVPLSQGGTTTAYPYVCAGDYWGVLPHDLAKQSPVEIVFSPFPPQIHNMLREQAFHVIEGDINAATAVNAFYEAIRLEPQRWLPLSDDFIPTAKMFARAVGRKNGRPAKVDCWFTAPLWEVSGYTMTSVALAVAVRKILRGEMQKRGVITAEKAFDPQSFFDETASLIPDLLPDGKLIEEAFEQLA